MDHGRVQRVTDFRQLQFLRLVFIEPTNSSHQQVCDFSEDSPVTVLVGISDVGTSGTRTKTGMVSTLRLEADSQIAQTFPVSELCEDQREKMIVSRKTARRFFHRKALRAAREFPGVD